MRFDIGSFFKYSKWNWMFAKTFWIQKNEQILKFSEIFEFSFNSKCYIMSFFILWYDKSVSFNLISFWNFQFGQIKWRVDSYSIQHFIFTWQINSFAILSKESWLLQKFLLLGVTEKMNSPKKWILRKIEFLEKVNSPKNWIIRKVETPNLESQITI